MCCGCNNRRFRGGCFREARLDDKYHSQLTAISRKTYVVQCYPTMAAERQHCFVSKQCRQYVRSTVEFLTADCFARRLEGYVAVKLFLGIIMV